MSLHIDRKWYALAGAVLAAVAVAAAFCVGQRPIMATAVILCGSFLTAFGATCFFRWQFPHDTTPDYLSRCRSTCLEYDGFCFSVSLDREDGVAIFTVMFQNRFAGPAVARLALRPVGSSLTTVSPRIECGPGAFGVAKFPVPIPVQHQGKIATFEIGIQTDYPQGKGRVVHCRAGQRVSRGSHSCLPEPTSPLSHAARGRVFHRLAATIRLALPTYVAEHVPDEVIGHVEELWRLPAASSSDRRSAM